MNAQQRLDVELHLEALKEVLRRRRISYADVAAALGCSLATVKRTLNRPSIPLGRLFELCDIAGIPFGDLHSMAESRRPQHHVFTEEQDHAIYERPQLLTYLMALASGKTPGGIAKEWDLDGPSTEAYLMALAALGLIERVGRTGARLLAQPPFGFGPSSKVLLARQEAFMQGIMEEVGGNPTSEAALFLKAVRLSSSDYREMIGALQEVVDRFAVISERGTGGHGAQTWRIALAAGPSRDEERMAIPRMS